MKLSNKSVTVSIGNKCPKCSESMKRKKHPSHWIPTKSYYFTEWDHCEKCKHVQHYDEFRSQGWQEQERQSNHLKNI